MVSRLSLVSPSQLLLLLRLVVELRVLADPIRNSSNKLLLRLLVVLRVPVLLRKLLVEEQLAEESRLVRQLRLQRLRQPLPHHLAEAEGNHQELLQPRLRHQHRQQLQQLALQKE